MSARSLPSLVLVILVAARATAGLAEPGAAEGPSTPAPAERIVTALDDPALRALLREVLTRNPQIAAAQARAAAAAQRAAQVGALPEPMAGLTAFLLQPETRVGPQQVAASLSQRFPWFGKLELKEQAAVHAAAAAGAEVEALRLALVTEARRLHYELGFADRLEQVVRSDLSTLTHYEELARARYGAGVGLQQVVIKIQAEITKARSRLLEIADRRATLVAALNALRDAPQRTAVPVAELPDLGEVAVDLESLRAKAIELRPEVAGADAMIERSGALIDLARKAYRPDVTLGVNYVLVGGREDPAGRLSPPPDNGDDVLGISAGINLPIRRKQLAAGVEEAVQHERAAQESRRAVITGIDRSLGELVERIGLTWRQLRLFEDVLIAQAEQSLLSAEAGYSAGLQNALDLLDAERVLLDVRTGTARNRADYAIAVARLEGAVGEPLPGPRRGGEEER